MGNVFHLITYLYLQTVTMTTGTMVMETMVTGRGWDTKWGVAGTQNGETERVESKRGERLKI